MLHKPDISPAEHKEHVYGKFEIFAHTHTHTLDWPARRQARSSRTVCVEGESHHRWVNIISEKKNLLCFVCAQPKRRKGSKTSDDRLQKENTMFQGSQTHYTSPPHIDRLLLLPCTFSSGWRTIFRGKNFMKREKISRKNKWFIFKNIFSFNSTESD